MNYKVSIKLHSFCHKTLDEYMRFLCQHLSKDKDVVNVSIAFLPVKIQRLAYIRSFFVKSYSGEHIETRIYTRYLTLTCGEDFNLNSLNEISIPSSIELKKVEFH